MNQVTERLIRGWERDRAINRDRREFAQLAKEHELRERLRKIGRGSARLLDRLVASFLTGTSSEVLYSSIATGTQLATFTTEDNLMKTLPYCIIPAGFFYNTQGATGKSLRVKACGRLGTTGAPTFTWNVRLLTSSTWSAGGIGFATAALTAGTGVTLAPWYLDVEIIMRTLATGAASTIAIMGEVRSALGLASPFAGTIPNSNVTFTNSTYDHSITNYLFLSAACGTSSGSNLIQLEMMKVYGEN